jgi:hypothetical protein
VTSTEFEVGAPWATVVVTVKEYVHVPVSGFGESLSVPEIV